MRSQEGDLTVRCLNSCTTAIFPYGFLPLYTAALMMDEKETLGRRRK